MTTISLGTYQAIHGIQQYLGDKDPNAIEQLTHVSAGGLIGGVALATTAFILIGDTIDHSREPDSNTYKGVADSPTYKP